MPLVLSTIFFLALGLRTLLGLGSFIVAFALALVLDFDLALVSSLDIFLVLRSALPLGAAGVLALLLSENNEDNEGNKDNDEDDSKSLPL